MFQFMRLQLAAAAALAGVSASALCAASGTALAGGFALREQSAEFQGMSFAGNAAPGGGLSGMFWNPAIVGQFNGMRAETGAALILPRGEITALPGTTLNAFPTLARTSGNIGETAVLPSSYFSYQLSQQFVMGLSINAPFGLSTKPENQAWVGQLHSRDSAIKTYNGQAALAWRLTPSLTVGGGVMVQLIDGQLKQAGPPGATAGSPDASFGGNDTGYGWTAGVTWKPIAGTQLGAGYRSQIEHTLTGSSFVSGAGGPSVAVPVTADLTLPETATVSLRQALTPQLALLATAEWTKWSRVPKLDITCAGVAAGLNCPSVGAISSTLPLGWHNSWFYSGGLEYAYSKDWTFRAGGAWEKSPIQNDSERTPRVPDNDRIWASAGLSAKANETVTVDLAYSHIWVDDGKIDRTASGTRLLADTKGSVDIFSVGFKIQLGGGSEPLK